METYTALASASFSSGSSLLAIFNGLSSAKIIRLHRIYCLNVQTVAINEDITAIEIWTTSSQSGGTPITPIKHDSTNSAIDGNVSIATGATVTSVRKLRRWPWYDQEVRTWLATAAEWEAIPALNIVWDQGYGNQDVEPLTLRQGEGVHVWHVGTMNVGEVDVIFQFTQATS